MVNLKYESFVGGKIMQTNNKKQLSSKADIGLAIFNAIENAIKEEPSMTRDYIAWKLGVTLRMVNYWQSGTKQPSLAKAVQLAEMLNCTLDSLLRN